MVDYLKATFCLCYMQLIDVLRVSRRYYVELKYAIIGRFCLVVAFMMELNFTKRLRTYWICCISSQLCSL